MKGTEDMRVGTEAKQKNEEWRIKEDKNVRRLDKDRKDEQNRGKKMKGKEEERNRR